MTSSICASADGEKVKNAGRRSKQKNVYFGRDEEKAGNKYKTGIKIKDTHTMAEVWAVIDYEVAQSKDTKGL